MLDWTSYIFAKGIAFAPRFFRSFLIYIVFALLIILPHPYRKRIRISIKTFYPTLSFWRREALVYKNMFHSLAVLFDMLAMWFRGKEWTAKQVKKIHNEHLIDDALQNDRNVIFVSYHFGNWEVLAPYLTSKFQCYNIYKEVSNRYMDDTIQKYRKSCNIIGFQVDNRAAFKNILRALRENKKSAMMLMPDQRPQRSSPGLMANFLGKKTPFNMLGGKLIPAAKCDVILICGLSCGGGDYEIFMKKPPKAIYDQDPLVVTEAMNEGYEELMKLDIAQYNWLQDKFKYERRRQMRRAKAAE